jgi:putative phosphoesterase
VRLRGKRRGAFTSFGRSFVAAEVGEGRATLDCVDLKRLGIVSDTHGTLLPDVLDVLAACDVDLILHAGDIGGVGVLEELEQLAPVVAVAGNGDEPLYHRFCWDLRLHLADRRILLCHWYDNFGRIHPRYDRIAREWAPDALIYGHTHQALAERRGATLFLNPGYAGPPEDSRARTVATLDLTTFEPRIHALS